MSSTAHPPMRTFGRVKSRTIKPAQGVLLDTLLPGIAIPISEGRQLDLDALGKGHEAVWLEIGFGGGEHLAGQAKARPEVLFLGAEPFQNGAASALRHIDDMALQNVRVHVGDARDVMTALPDGSIGRVFIMFPDPWPKLRHHKRRLIQTAFVNDLTRILAPGGRIRFATDWADYADWALERFLAHPDLSWTAERAEDWRTAPPDHIPTRYQEKRLGDIDPVFLDFTLR